MHIFLPLLGLFIAAMISVLLGRYYIAAFFTIFAVLFTAFQIENDAHNLDVTEISTQN